MLSRPAEIFENSSTDNITSVWQLNPDKFSSSKRLTRTQVWNMRFIPNCHACKNEGLLNDELM